MILGLFLLSSLTVNCFCEVLFFARAPRIEPAKLEITGFAVQNADDGLIVDQKDVLRGGNQETDDVESRRSPFGGSGYPEAAQRYFGLGVFGLGNRKLVYPAGRTQTIFETTTRTSVVLRSCILCTCALAAVGDGTQCGSGVDVPGFAAVCGAGPMVGPVPPVCPASKKRRSSEEDFLTGERESIHPSRILQVVPSEQARFLVPRSASSFPVESSFDESHHVAQARKFDYENGFEYVVKRTLTVMTTVTGSLTAQIQVGNLNCLPQYLTTAPYCTSIGK